MTVGELNEVNWWEQVWQKWLGCGVRFCIMFVSAKNPLHTWEIATSRDWQCNAEKTISFAERLLHRDHSCGKKLLFRDNYQHLFYLWQNPSFESFFMWIILKLRIDVEMIILKEFKIVCGVAPFQMEKSKLSMFILYTT